MSSNIKVERACEHCKKLFTARTTVTRFCSKLCNKRGYKSKLRIEKINSSNAETLKKITEPIEVLKAKPYLSIEETSVLLGISRRTIYRLFENGKIEIGKAGRRTIIRSSELENLFNNK